MSRHSVERPVPRRGLSRVEAAMYIGVSPRKFDELRAAGLMPKPKLCGGRKIWDRYELDLSFESLSDDNDGPATTAGNSWSDA